MKPNFKNINIKKSIQSGTSAADWESKHIAGKEWMTSEQIGVKPVFNKERCQGK